MGQYLGNIAILFALRLKRFASWIGMHLILFSFSLYTFVLIFILVCSNLKNRLSKGCNLFDVVFKGVREKQKA